MDAPSLDLTTLLNDWANGNEEALERLFPLVRMELRRRASRLLTQETRGHVLQPTMLINDALMRLRQHNVSLYNNRKHFYAIAAKVMRQVLVDDARKRNSDKRGGGKLHESLSEVKSLAERRGWDREDIVALNEALDRLGVINPYLSKLVDLLYFGGVSSSEAAETLGVDESRIKRDWDAARAWLYRELSGGMK